MPPSTRYAQREKEASKLAGSFFCAPLVNLCFRFSVLHSLYSAKKKSSSSTRHYPIALLTLGGGCVYIQDLQRLVSPVTRVVPEPVLSRCFFSFSLPCPPIARYTDLVRPDLPGPLERMSETQICTWAHKERPPSCQISVTVRLGGGGQIVFRPAIMPKPERLSHKHTHTRRDYGTL